MSRPGSRCRKPYAAVVVRPCGELAAANPAFGVLTEGAAPRGRNPDQCAAPCPASRRDGPPGRNLAEWGRHITSSLRNRVQQSPDPSLETFTTELDAYLPGAHPHAGHLGFARAVAAAGTGRRTAPDYHVHIVRDRRRCHTVRAAPRSIPARRRDHGNNPQAAEMISPAKSRRMRCARMCSATSTWLTRALPGCHCTRSAAHWTGSQPSPGAAGTACGRPMSASLRLGRHTQCSPAGRPGRHRPCAGSRSRSARKSRRGSEDAFGAFATQHGHELPGSALAAAVS